jgi:hypothetical protein
MAEEKAEQELERRAKKRGNDGGQGKRKGSKSKKAFLQSNFKSTLAL